MRLSVAGKLERLDRRAGGWMIAHRPSTDELMAASYIDPQEYFPCGWYLTFWAASTDPELDEPIPYRLGEPYKPLEPIVFAPEGP